MKNLVAVTNIFPGDVISFGLRTEQTRTVDTVINGGTSVVVEFAHGAPSEMFAPTARVNMISRNYDYERAV